MEQALVDGVLGPLAELLGIETARKLASFEIPGSVQARVRTLGARSNEGTLTDEERAEYEGYVTVANVLALLKSRARLMLRQDG